MKRIAILAAILALLVAALGAPAALAASPTNDAFASATVIAALPFSDVVDNTSATTEPGEPQACAGSPRTVWYSFTPATSEMVPRRHERQHLLGH